MKICQTHPAPELDKELLKSMTRKRKAEKNAFSTCDARIHLQVSDTRQYTFEYAPVMSCRIQPQQKLTATNERKHNIA